MSSKNWTLVAAVLGSAVVFLDSSVLPVALALIGREPRLFLDVFEALNYVHYGYLLTLSALLVLAGALTDYYGRRRMFGIGLVGFGLTSLACGLAPNLELLVLFRLLQGAAGALLVPASLALLTNAFSGEEQGRAFGVWAAASGAAVILGPFVGGVLVQEISWRAIFLLNLPLIAFAIWAVRAHVAESRDPQATGNFDWLGAGLVALAVGGLSFGAIYGEQRQWQDPLAFVALGAGALSAVALPFYFGRVRHPLVPLSMFRSRNFSVTNLSTLLIYGALYVTFFLVPIYLQGSLGYSAAAVGLGMVPSSIFLVFLSTRFGALASRLGPRRFMAIGPLLMGAGVLWLARIPPDSQPWQLALGDPQSYLPSPGYLVDVLPAMIVHGLGIAIMVAPLTTALMRSVPGRQAGLASAINNAVSRVGPQLAGALIFVVVTMTFYAAIGQRLPALDITSPEVRAVIPPLAYPTAELTPEQLGAVVAASTEAFRLAMVAAAALAILGGLINGLWISDRQARGGSTDAEAGTPEASAAG
jgi:EmrB/QacA subfamily drug resistance transporter